MLNNIKKKTEERGFTIIEVMIVLAIAGLIILIVLLAVPALQRSGRNTAIKNDASAIVAGISEFSSNNDGGLPTTGGSSYVAGSGTVVINNATGTAFQSKIQSSTTVAFGAATVAAYTPLAGSLYIDYGVKCPNPAVAGTTVTPVVSTRSSVVIYALETPGALQAKCIDS